MKTQAAFTVSKTKDAKNTITKKPKTGTDSITYPGTKRREALKYGPATVFWDTINNCWRVKPCPGSRCVKNYKFTNKPKKQWETVVKPVLE